MVDSTGAFVAYMVSALVISVTIPVTVFSATAYGDGVYFAVNASYSESTRYSPADSNGNRHIFLARVLTGKYTVGKSGLRTPPPIDANKSIVDLYDSVVDSMSSTAMFVIFYDAQCYPEYLITFK